MKKVRLKEICDQIRGVSYSGDDSVKVMADGFVPILRANNIGANYELNLKDLVYVPKSYVSEKQLLKKGDILMAASSGSIDVIGKTVFIPEDLFMAFGAFCKVIRVKNNRILPKFLAHYFQTPSFRAQISHLATGANINNINNGNIDSLEIIELLPAEQIKITFTLDTVEQIRRARNYSLSALDYLQKAVFFEVFGNPLTNSKNWEITRLDKLGDIVTGNTPSRVNSEYYDEPFIEWIKSDNIGSNNIFLKDAKEYLSEKGCKVARTVPHNSILVTCIAGSPNSIGNAALANRQVAFNQQINAIVPKQNISHWFLLFLMKFGKKLVQNQSTDGMKGLVSKSKFAEIKVFLPPKDLRDKFDIISENYIKLREFGENYLKEAENLQKSLLQKAFSGTLKIDEKAWKRLDTEGWVKNYIETGSPTPKPYEDEFIPLPIESFTIETNGKKTEYSNIGNMLTDVKNYATEAFGKKGYFTFEALEKVLHEQTQIQYPYKELKDYIFRELDRKDGWFEQEFLLDEKRDKSKGTDDSRIVFRIKEQVPPQ